MNKVFNMTFIICIFSTLVGCSAKDLGSIVAGAADTQVRYSQAQCNVLRQQCQHTGDYQEWETSEKEMGCSCKKL